MNKYQIAVFVIIAILTLSCEKNCERFRKELDIIDLRSLRPVGIFKGVNGSKYTITSDSTAVLSYTVKDSSYEITYKIQTLYSFKYNFI